MRYLVGTVLLFHGLLHLMGPAKAFGWLEIPQLQRPISKGAGAGWLIAALLFVAAAGLLVLAPARFPDREWWWLPSLAAIVLSQSLIAGSWADAKYGSFANLFLLIPTLLALIAALSSTAPG